MNPEYSTIVQAADEAILASEMASRAVAAAEAALASVRLVAEDAAAAFETVLGKGDAAGIPRDRLRQAATDRLNALLALGLDLGVAAADPARDSSQARRGRGKAKAPEVRTVPEASTAQEATDTASPSSETPSAPSRMDADGKCVNSAPADTNSANLDLVMAPPGNGRTVYLQESPDTGSPPHAATDHGDSQSEILQSTEADAIEYSAPIEFGAAAADGTDSPMTETIHVGEAREYSPPVEFVAQPAAVQAPVPTDATATDTLQPEPETLLEEALPAPATDPCVDAVQVQPEQPAAPARRPSFTRPPPSAQLPAFGKP